MTERGGEMTTVIFNPLEEFDTKYRALHGEKTNQFFDELTQRSGVDIELNRKTVAQYNQIKENLVSLRRKFNWLRFWRVLMCITILPIPLVILKVTPKIRQLREQISDADALAEKLLTEAYAQMQPLNNLFTDRDALHIIEQTVPLMDFHDYFSVKQEADMRINYDFALTDDDEQSTLDVLAGHYNENPFLFENKLVHTMGEETYHGYLTIYWTETYFEDGKLRTRQESDTLHATVTKPKPFYNTQVVLNYCSQGGPELTFSRDASHLEQKNDRQIDRMIRRGERKLSRKANKALKGDGDFTSMSNTEFEVLFDALDRSNEVQFRTLFTPLAQTNMVELIRSKVGYGDDFNFLKRNRTNLIVSNHSQGRDINLLPGSFASYCYDTIRQNFVGKNTEFFKAVYFDFAPLLAIPLYQERPVHSLKPVPDYDQQYSLKESEALANAVDSSYVLHPDSKTPGILKSSFVASQDSIDETCITAYSYDIAKRVEMVRMLGGDGKFHNVPVEWDEYLPLEMQSTFYVASNEAAKGKSILTRRSGLCIFNEN